MNPPLAEKKTTPSFLKFATLLAAVLGLSMLLTMRDPDEVPPSVIPPSNRPSAKISEFPNLQGGAWRLADHRGKVVLVNVWATWCPPCRAETPDLVKLSQELKGKGLDVVGVSMDEGDDSTIKRFISDFGVPYPIVRGLQEPTFSVGIPLPTTQVYDRQGRLALYTVGAIDPEPFRKILESILDEPS